MCVFLFIEQLSNAFALTHQIGVYFLVFLGCVCVLGGVSPAHLTVTFKRILTGSVGALLSFLNSSSGCVNSCLLLREEVTS